MNRARGMQTLGTIAAALLAAAALYCCQGHGTGNSPAATVVDAGAESDSSVHPDGASEAASGNITPLFMDPYVVWQKGINYVGNPADITFERTELWASPYDDNPAKLKPAKVADLPQTFIESNAVGGFGQYALFSASPGGAGYPRTVNTWRIPDGQHRAITPQILIDTLAGVTREAIYFAARSWQSYQGETETIHRVELASMPTVP